MSDRRESPLLRPDAERAVLATLVLRPDLWVDVAGVLSAEDFFGQGHAALFGAMARSVDECGTFDPAALLGVAGVPDGMVHRLSVDTAPSPGLFGRHVRVVIEAAVRYRAVQRMGEAMSAINRGGDASDALAPVRDAIEDVDTPPGAVPKDFMEAAAWTELADSSPRPWVIPGVVRRTGRVVFVAQEGAGKSTLGFQILFAVAAGLHPFWLHPIEPRRVLMIDVENDPSTARGEDGRVALASPLGIKHTTDIQLPEWEQSNAMIWSREEGINLRSRRGRSELLSVLRASRPDLLVLGPVYKLFPKRAGEDDETVSVDIQGLLDRVRIRFDCAIWLEHHAGKGGASSDSKNRRMDPYGSSLWYRWPDIGIAAMQDKDTKALVLDRFRGDRYLAPKIPRRLDRGSPWPWVGWWAEGLSPASSRRVG